MDGLIDKLICTSTVSYSSKCRLYIIILVLLNEQQQILSDVLNELYILTAFGTIYDNFANAKHQGVSTSVT